MSKASQYLANNKSKEIHDLSNPVMNCQLEKLDSKSFIFLKSEKEMKEFLNKGYDGCPFCLRSQSQKAKKSS
jgi:hypothetical protein